MMILQQTRGNLSSGDQLALDLPFAATKSLTARVGPTPILTRASGATYVGSDGLIHGVDTSTTSNSIGTGSNTFTLSAPAGQDQLWRTGDAVEVTNGTNSMFGAVTSYDANTQVLVCNITSITGSGTFNSWRIGYRGPRFDHDPVTLASKGLLIEEQRQNLLSRSEEFNQTFWTKLRASVSADLTTSPSGDSSADKLVEDSGSGTHMTYRLISTGALAAHTFSVFAKADGRDFVYLACADNFTANSFAYFDLTNGTLGNVGAGATASITSFGNGWYRCSITATTTATTTNGVYIQTASANGVVSYQGDGTSGVFIWGAQLEAGSFATSYIPTTTSALIRSADVCNIADTSSFWNSSEFTLFTSARFQTSGVDAYASNFNITGGFFGIRRTSLNTAQGIVRSPAVNADFNFGSFTTGDMRIALSHSTGQQAGSLNGSTPTVKSTLFTPSSNPSFAIGANNTSGTFPINGHIAAIRYYKKRLPDAKLVTLTT